MRVVCLSFVLVLVLGIVALACGDSAGSSGDAGPGPLDAGADQTDAAGGDGGVELPNVPPVEDAEPAPEVSDPGEVIEVEAEVGPDCGGLPYCPCQGDDDCLSAFCIFTPEGKVCTEACGECLEGWSCRQAGEAIDPVYICLPNQPTLCLPCQTDADCAYAGFAPGQIQCVDYGAEVGSFCGGACDGDRPCPQGHTCQSGQCILEAGVCPCSPWAIQYGMDTTCARSNEWGTCPGERSCGAAGLSACSAPLPAAETCNASDDDCDGQTDEGLGTLSCGLGPCAHQVPACVDGATGSCHSQQGAQPEACNGVDDDCDDQTDEGFADDDGDGLKDCVDPDDDGDGVPDDGNASGTAGDAPCAPGQVTGCDDNCPFVANPDQADQDGDGKGDPCDPDRDGDGYPAQARGGGDCDDTDPARHPGAAEGEVYGAARCDGIDNDCDGLTDEGYANFEGDGLKDCVDPDDDNDGDPDSTDCAPLDAHVAHGKLEICNGRDDDCDGQTDEGYLDSDGDGIAECVEKDRDGDGDPDVSDCAPDDNTIFHGQSELCDGVDQNCNGVKDEGYSDFDGDGKADCVDGDDDDDGDPDATDCAPLDATRAHGNAELCNQIDDDCDGDTDEGSLDTDADGVPDCLDPDDDEDGRMDGVDNCPLTWNPDQVDTDGDKQGDACDPDDDGDGVPDAQDNCPLLASADTSDTDQDGRGDACDPDDDDDGRSDWDDNCPKAFNPDQADYDADGKGDPCDPDRDGDGVANDADTCPYYDDKVDADGDGIPNLCEIFFAGHVWPVQGAVAPANQPLTLYLQMWKQGQASGPLPGVSVTVRYKKAGDAQWSEGSAAYHKDFEFTDDKGHVGYNEEHAFTIPGAFVGGGGALDVDFVPTDCTGGPDHCHTYNNGPIYDQGWMVGKAKSAAPFTYPVQ